MKWDIPGFVCAFVFAPDGSNKPLAEADVRISFNDPISWFWLHLNLTDSRCVLWLSETLKQSRALIEEFASSPRRVHITRLGNVLVGHVNDLRREFDRDSSEHAWLHFMVSDQWIITGRSRALQSAENVRRDLARCVAFLSPEALLDAFFAHNLNCLETLLHEFTEEAETIEDHILDDRHRDERRKLAFLRRECSTVHRHVRTQRRALQHASRAIERLPPGMANSLSRLDNLDSDFSVLENRARTFHDEIDAKLAAETNRQLYILSVLTAAFLPPTLVTGLFGMNFQWLPWSESGWGFFIALGIGAVSSISVGIFLSLLQRK